MKVRNIVLAAGVASGLFLVGCEEAKNAASQTTSAVGDAAKKAGDAAKTAATTATDAAGKAVEAGKDAAKAAGETVSDATKAAGDVAGKAVEGAKDAAAGVADAAAKALESAKAESTKWLTDTVEKQWPGMKTQLEDAAKKVGGIKDAAVKTKAEGLVKDLQGQIPAIEKTVTDIKNLDWSKIKLDDFSKMKETATKAWDAFGGKLKELTGMLPK